jgi:hypothetical protein
VQISGRLCCGTPNSSLSNNCCRHSPWNVAGGQQGRDEVISAVELRDHLRLPVGQQPRDSHVRVAAAQLVSIWGEVLLQELTQKGAQPA